MEIKRKTTFAKTYASNVPVYRKIYRNETEYKRQRVKDREAKKIIVEKSPFQTQFVSDVFTIMSNIFQVIIPT